MMKDKAECNMQIVYYYNEIMYVPHYQNNSFFVGPGYPTHNKFRYSAHDLIQAGARKDVYPLWSRGISNPITDRNP
jgi:hypothetical protein